MKQAGLVLAIALAVAGCEQGQPEQNSNIRTLPATGSGRVAPAPPAPHPPPPARGPVTTTSETTIGLDPESGEAAKALVESYCDLLKREKYVEAHRLWSGDTLSDRQFARQLTGYGQLEACVVDEAGAHEGAAGSVYTSVPLELFFSGGRVRLSGSLTLRRANDVPGSTEEQRHWHIVRSELQPVD